MIEVAVAENLKKELQSLRENYLRETFATEVRELGMQLANKLRQAVKSGEVQYQLTVVSPETVEWLKQVLVGFQFRVRAKERYYEVVIILC